MLYAILGLLTIVAILNLIQTRRLSNKLWKMSDEMFIEFERVHRAIREEGEYAEQVLYYSKGVNEKIDTIGRTMDTIAEYLGVSEKKLKIVK